MTRRPTPLRPLVLVLVLGVGVLTAGCSGDDSDGGRDDGRTERSTTTSEAVETTTTSTTTVAADPASLCEPYLALRLLRASVDGIATGSREGQEAADAQQEDVIEDLRAGAGGATEIVEALDTIAASSFQVTDRPTGPTAAEVDAALLVLQATYGPACVPATTTTTVPPTTAPPPTAPPIPCPSQQALDAEGLACDENGRLYPVGESPTTAPVEAPSPCPSAEELAAEGLSCDANGEIHANEGDDYQY